MLVNASSNALLDSAALAVDAVLTMTAIGIVEDNPILRVGFTRAALSTDGRAKVNTY
jgi:hypothetical protein